MFFYMPVKVYSEMGCVKNHAGDLASLGTKALIVTGRHSAAANGSLKDVEEALESRGISWVHFSEVEENPSTETVMKARDLGLREGADFVIGIGGGSPLDAAKAAALMLEHPAEGEDYLYDREAAAILNTAVFGAKKDAAEHSSENARAYAPIALIPTTCGTGSEVTAISVLTRRKLQKKGSIPFRIFADLALLDGTYLAFASPRILANTTMDAFAHLTESYINSSATPYSRVIAEEGLRVWARSKEKLLRVTSQEASAADGRLELSDYVTMLDASMLAGMAIAHTGTSVPHGLSYALTIFAGVPHGKACGYYLKGYLDAADPKDAAHVLDLAGFKDSDEFETYYRATCGDVKIPEEILWKSYEDVYTAPSRLKTAPFPIDDVVLKRIIGL